MNVALLAGNNKKELMVQFCIAYCGILTGHSLCATGTMAKLITEATGLKVKPYLSAGQGGLQQIAARIAYNELDLVLFFCDPQSPAYETELSTLCRLCDQYTIPFASNVATAEVLVHGLQRGDLDWRDIVNPKK